MSVGQAKDSKPKMKKKHKQYLDDLRESGVTNMFGAAPYLTFAFGINKNDARLILQEWMDTFSEDDNND